MRYPLKKQVMNFDASMPMKCSTMLVMFGSASTYTS
jgi:hypothetical protein